MFDSDGASDTKEVRSPEGPRAFQNQPARQQSCSPSRGSRPAVVPLLLRAEPGPH